MRPGASVVPRLRLPSAGPALLAPRRLAAAELRIRDDRASMLVNTFSFIRAPSTAVMTVRFLTLTISATSPISTRLSGAFGCRLVTASRSFSCCSGLSRTPRPEAAPAWAENRTSADASRSASTRRKSAAVRRLRRRGPRRPTGPTPGTPFRDECPSRRPPLSLCRTSTMSKSENRRPLTMSTGRPSSSRTASTAPSTVPPVSASNKTTVRPKSDAA